MKFEFDPSNVAQGRQQQQKQIERPATFGTQNNAEQVTQATRLDKPQQRMAGQMGERILEFMENPEEQERTMAWMQAFGKSNQGMEFNQAKMMLSGYVPPGMQQEQQGGQGNG